MGKERSQWNGYVMCMTDGAVDQEEKGPTSWFMVIVSSKAQLWWLCLQIHDLCYFPVNDMYLIHALCAWPLQTVPHSQTH